MPGPADTLLEKLDRCVQNEAGNTDRSFLTREALNRFWEQEVEDINRLWLPADQPQRDHLQSHLARITCILLRIKFRHAKYPRILRKLITTPSLSHSPDAITDANLPLSRSQCDVWGQTYAQEFHTKQYTLLEPVYIDCDSSELVGYDYDRRLPYVDQGEIIGEGAFGVVSKVKILRQYCRRQGFSNDEDKLVAVKTLHTRQALQRENQNNAYLKGNILNHRNVLVHLAAILHHTTFYIFMDLAPHGDLETLLSGGTRRDTYSVETRHYNISHIFPNATRYHVFQALHDLTQALDFLHHKVVNPDDRQPLRLAHNDFRPQNILIFEEQGQPIGRWKIADFGISTPRRNLSSSSPSTPRGRLVIGDLLPAPPTQAHERSMDCPQHAPEVSSTFYNRDQKADIWSLGTIFAEVLAFTQGFDLDRPQWSKMDSEVDNLRRIYGRSFYSLTPGQNIVSFSLKSGVRDWLHNLSQIDQHHKEYVGIIYLMLRPIPEKRKDAALVWHRLDRVLRHMRSGIPYTHPFDLAREEARLEPWRPVPRQPETTDWTSLTTVFQDNELRRPEKDLYTVEVTSSVMLLREHRRHSIKNELLCVRPIEVIPSHLVGKVFSLPSHVRWKSLEISGVYGCATGTQEPPAGSCEYFHFSLEIQKVSPSYKPVLEEEPLKQAIPARTAVIALCYDSCIKLRSFFHNIEELLPSLDGGVFKSIAFNDAGDKLFARISYPEKPRQDILAVWKVNPGRAPNLLTRFKVERPTQKVVRTDFHVILPWKDQVGGLMVYQNGHRGLLITALTDVVTSRRQAEVPAHYQKESRRPDPGTISAAVTNEYFMLVDVERNVWLYKLGVDSGKLCLDCLGYEELPVKKASWFVLRKVSDSSSRVGLQLVLRDKNRDRIYNVNLDPSDKKQRWELLLRAN